MVTTAKTGPAIKTEGLRKDFGSKTAVADLALEVQRGEVFGFLGPNGAGKTTSVKMLLGLVHPTSGTGTVLGHKIGAPAGRARIGFLPEHFRFHEWLTGAEFLRLHADLYRIPGSQAISRIGALLERVGLAAHADKKLSAYSKGMLQRIGLAQALLNQPYLVILDEPTSGLDPLGRRLVRDLIRELREEGTTVFLNSHLLSEVEITCDRVAFIKRGQVVGVDAVKSFMDGEVALDIQADGLSPEIVDGLNNYGRGVEWTDDRISMVVDSDTLLPEVNRFLVEHGVAVYALTPRQVSLEDLFMQIVGTDGEL